MQVLVTSAVILVIACSLLKEVEATRIRLSLNSLHEANMTTRKVSSTLYQTPCKKDGKINLPDGIKEFKEEVKGELKNIKGCKFYSSPDITAKINELVELPIVGTTFKAKEFLDMFVKNEKPIYIFGGAVRDLLMGKPVEDIKDIDAETSYDLKEVLKLCEATFNSKEDLKLCHELERIKFF